MVTPGSDALWEQGLVEAVEVNQRALIDKILARYSGEFTVFRELLQNADDAHATAAEIRFGTNQHLAEQEQEGKTESVIEQGATTNTSVDPTSSKQPNLPDLKKIHVDQWTFRNNGMPFRDQDWDRLKRIAEGNPDEKKIGAFGVGFYSIFSVTEAPLVKSGTKYMKFFWRNGGDQLFVRRGDLPAEPNSAPNEWTSFEMPLRESAPLPGLPVDVARFLATSLTFMAHLRKVSLFFDGQCLARIEKDSGAGVPRSLSIPSGLKVTSPGGMMKTTGMTSRSMSMKATVPRWVYDTGTNKKPTASDRALRATSFFLSLFSPSTSPSRSRAPTPVLAVPEKDPLEEIVSSVQLSVFAAQVSVQLDRKMSTELERATKKKPPATLTYQLIYADKDEFDASEEDERDCRHEGSVFQGLRADLDGTGHTHVFIGHATAQTTGIGGHVAAPYIPTVERESIDLVDRNVSKWNRELLYVGGLLARAVYEIQMNDINERWSVALRNVSPDDEAAETTKAQLQSRGLHVLRFFTFHPTTPSRLVSDISRAAFFTSNATSSHSFPIISTFGVRPARDVRVDNANFTSFLKNTPLLSPEAARDGRLMLAALRERGMCMDVTFQDVVMELRARILDGQEAVALLKWRLGLDAELTRVHERELRENLLGAARFRIKEAKSDKTIDEREICLATIRTYIDPQSSLIPLDSPLPDHTLPVAIGTQLGNANLKGLGWGELSVPEWITHLINSSTQRETGVDITHDTVSAECMLKILARAWSSMDAAQQQDIYMKLSEVKCIPTGAGLKVPGEAYFASIHVFSDLPIVVMPEGTIIDHPMEEVLVALGVRRHVDPQIVFSRMIDTGDWTTADLIKYFVAVRDTLSTSELDHLKQTPVFMREGEARHSGDGESNSPPKRYMAKDLYEPTDTLRSLGLPILFWSEQVKWHSNLEESEFMFELGLQRHPSLEAILSLAGSQDTHKRSVALKYFIDNHSACYTLYNANAFPHLAFVPAIRPDGTSFLTNPTMVYSNPECAVMGFDVVDPTLGQEAIVKLQIVSDPPTPALIAKLLGTTPQDQTLSRRYYEYLASRITSFKLEELRWMSNSTFIPATKTLVAANGTKTSTQQMFKPTQVYFDSSNSRNDAHSALFAFVDFGPKAAIFLRAVGVKDEPTTRDVCITIMQNPEAFKDAFGYEGYLAELKRIGAQISAFSSNLRQIMARSPMLIGTKQAAKDSMRSPGEGRGSEAGDTEIRFELLRATDIVIIDDVHSNSLFGHELWGAPQEDMIEHFYEQLGSKRLSSLVHEDYSHVPSQNSSTEQTQHIRTLVLERLPLFVHGHTQMKCRIKPDWLAQGDHFQVVMVKRLQLTRRLKLGRGFSAIQEASAAAERMGAQGSVFLWLAENSETDLYEVANSLCKVLFENHKVNDSLAFTAILATDLQALKRRGYNVDRILNQQRAEHLRAESARMQQERERKEARDAEASAEQTATQALPTIPEISVKNVAVHQPAIVNQQPKGSLRRTFNNIRQKFRRSLGLSDGSSQHKTKSLLGPSDKSKPSSASPGLASRPSGQVMPPDRVESNVRMAIAACRPESQSLLPSNQYVTVVKESLGELEDYCDINGSADDFVLLGEIIPGYRVYIAKDIPDPNLLAAQKLPGITRFADLVLTPLRALYKLPLLSVHIFYDTKGPLIAFNRKGSLFLNLRYYEDWHDELVQAGHLDKALISWYFSLAHEIAHNLVRPHNADHEYYFSSIAEQHMSGLSALLTRS